MNIITAALRKKKKWKEKLELFREYGNNPLLCQTFDRVGPTHNNRAILDARLQELRWQKGLPREPNEVSQVAITYHEEEIEKPQESSSDQPSESVDRLYPKSIELAIVARSKAINRRERAGRKLTQFAEDLTKEERAKLVKVQKDQHAIVAAKTRLINHFRKTGEVLKKGQLTEQEELEKEWHKLRRGLSTLRKREEDECDPDAKAAATKKRQEAELRYEELRVLLGKQKRNRRKTA